MLSEAGVNEDNIESIASFSEKDDEYGTYHRDGQIMLERKKSIKQMVVMLSHELTNYKNRNLYAALLVSLLSEMTPEEYASKKLDIEDESSFSQYKVAKEIGLKKIGTRYANKILRKYKRGEYTDASLMTLIKEGHFYDINPKTGRRVYDLYLENAEMIKKAFKFDDPGEKPQMPHPENENRLFPNLDSGGYIGPNGR